MIISHMTGMRSHGQVTLRFMAWPDFTGARVAMWQSVMRAMLLAKIDE